MEGIPLHSIRCRSCHDSTKRPVMTHMRTPGEAPSYTVGCPNKCMDAVYMEIDIPLRQFPAAFQHLLEQPHTDQLALDDPRIFFYVPQQAGDKEQ